MTLLDLFARDVAGPLTLGSAPTDRQTAWMRRRAQELVEATSRLARAEALVDRIRARKTELERRALPEIMDQLQTDSLGLPESGVDIVVQPYCSASIPRDWDDDRRSAAFAQLEACGGGSLIQTTVVVAFPKEDLELARRFEDAAGKWLEKAAGNVSPPVPLLDMGVHHGTLTSWVRAELERRQGLIADGWRLATREEMIKLSQEIPLPPRVLPPLDLDAIGATTGRICRVVRRKEKKTGGRRGRK